MYKVLYKTGVVIDLETFDDLVRFERSGNYDVRRVENDDPGVYVFKIADKIIGTIVNIVDDSGNYT